MSLNTGLNPGQKRKNNAVNHSSRAPTKRAKPSNVPRREIHAQRSIPGLDPVTGALDVATFVSAREYEIRALEKAMQRDRKTLSQRAFQQVPRNMRRRGASHNAKKVPKRLKKRAEREMKEDNTPTVSSKTRPKSRLSRIRRDKAKKLMGLNARTKEQKKQTKAEGALNPEEMVDISRAPKTKKNVLDEPPKATSRFKRRQVHKTWLPTHLWHAKRAHMSKSTEPLWRMAIPIEPTEKSYRPTHRAAGGRGSIAWDMSYISTIGCNGDEEAVIAFLRTVGIDVDHRPDLWNRAAMKWRHGTRALQNWAKDPFDSGRVIAPVTVLWCPVGREQSPESSKPQRTLLIRVHPSAFLQLWNVVLRVAKEQSPAVMIEDLRWQIGSIDITGPSSTEALQGVLKPVTTSAHGDLWTQLEGLTNPASIPYNAIIAFDVEDPRLHNASHNRKNTEPDSGTDIRLANLLANWTADRAPSISGVFYRKSRYSACKGLPSQKSINRRRALAPPGQPPARKSTDPNIPIVLMASRCSVTTSNIQGTWTVLLPWKCVDIFWRRLLLYPLSSGSTPRFGGLKQQQQLAFERREPWFPGDYPGTEAGDAWGRTEDDRRKLHWKTRPPGRRINFQNLDLGNGEKGELGEGWSTDWKYLSHTMKADDSGVSSEPRFVHAHSSDTVPLLNYPLSTLPLQGHTLMTVRINYLTKGTPSAAARIYNLPSAHQYLDIREKWLGLDPGLSLQVQGANRLQKNRLNHRGDIKLHHAYPAENIDSVNVPGYDPAWDEEKRVKAKASNGHKKALISNGISEAALAVPSTDSGTEKAPDHPPCPTKDDLIGFVTSGAYNLAEGRGTAVGSIWMEKLFKKWIETDAFKQSNIKACANGKQWQRQKRLVVVRNAGETIGRLAIWEVV